MIDIDAKRQAPKRQTRVAVVAAIVGCAACCAIPLLAAAGIGGSAAASVAGLMRPGVELIAGAAAFGATLGFFALRSRLKRAGTCGPSCKVDGSCCNRGKRATGA